jgi:hypothetical protein
MKATKTAQQGDVLLQRVTVDLTNAKKQAKGRVTVRHGESGHSHVIENATMLLLGDELCLQLEKDATLLHEEHKPIELEAGIWEVGQVQEYDWLEKLQRPVID